MLRLPGSGFVTIEVAYDPVPLDYSIVSLTCSVTSRFDAVMVALPGAAQDRLCDSSSAT
jgi:hypothetical protein